jgi:hypothetical protein
MSKALESHTARLDEEPSHRVLRTRRLAFADGRCSGAPDPASLLEEIGLEEALAAE